MRVRGKVSLLVVGVLLLATKAMAQTLPMSCSANGWFGNNGLWTLTATGPIYVGGNTQISYVLTPLTGMKPDHVVTLVTVIPGQPNDTPTVTPLDGATIQAACEGDPLTGLGKLSCHQRAIRVAGPSLYRFTASMSGIRRLVPTSFVVRDSKRESSCAIAGLGEAEVVAGSGACVSTCGNFHPRQTLLKEEVFRFLTGTGKSCFARFRRDLSTGEVIDAGLTSTSDPVSPSDIDCDFEEYPLSDLQLILGGNIVIGGSSGVGGEGQHGDGIISTGSDSCTTRVIGGRVYTWGDPCPQ